MDHRIPPEGLAAFLRGAYGHGEGQVTEMIPFPEFLRPGIPGDPKRSDDQDILYLSAFDQLLNGGERNHALAQTHLKQNRCNRMG